MWHGACLKEGRWNVHCFWKSQVLTFWGPGLPRRNNWAALDEQLLSPRSWGFGFLNLEKEKGSVATDIQREGKPEMTTSVTCRAVPGMCMCMWDMYPEERHWRYSGKINLGNTGWISTPFSIWNNKSYWVDQNVHLGFSISYYRKPWMNFLANPILIMHFKQGS